MQKGKYDIAEQQFKIAFQKNPNLTEAYLNIGQVCARAGWINGCENNTKKTIEISERTHETYIEGNRWKESLSLAYTNLGAVECARAAKAE